MKARFIILLSFPALMILGFGQGQLSTANGIEFIKVAPGEFMMGCSTGDTECNPDENPRHRVQISKVFEIGKYEVTQEQWIALMQSNPSAVKGDSRPVENVSKFDALDFIARLNQKNDGYHYRLPTEAEWEYAARAGLDSPHTGPIDEMAWFAGNSEDETHPVGLKKPNVWGLYDMQGNVREWVSDLYSETYYSSSPLVDPQGPEPCPNGVSGPGGGPRGQFGPDGRGGRGRGGPTGPPPPNGPPSATQQEQINELRRQVQDLQQQVQQLRNQIQAGPPRGGPVGPPNRGGPRGPGGRGLAGRNT